MARATAREAKARVVRELKLERERAKVREVELEDERV